jgi:hypothetical protein|mmetsp:Transcript_31078/g.33946  ORF Transcript_31078/g.33946 Transcript_31078/m.33946 type:complete len:125 (+) Transcript_31078:43-417(+)|eukprot:gene2932-3119_t
MSRVTKQSARELIAFAKNLKIWGHYWDPKARSAFEFARQMQAPPLKKVNPAFECTLVQSETNEPARLIAEFLDGSKWETKTGEFSLKDLRAEFFAKAADAEDNADIVPGGDAGKKGDKGGKGKK